MTRRSSCTVYAFIASVIVFLLFPADCAPFDWISLSRRGPRPHLTINRWNFFFIGKLSNTVPTRISCRIKFALIPLSTYHVTFGVRRLSFFFMLVASR